jgi:hypothetical protein
MKLALDTGRPRMEADVADAGDPLRDGDFLISFFFAVTK